MERPLRYHWSLSHPGLLGLDAQRAVCRDAEESGFDSVFVADDHARPDPLVLAVALGRGTRSIKFMVACRSGLISPTYFVQQVNTASALIDGRVHVNVVCGRTPRERTDEFLTVCHAFWRREGEVNFRGKYYEIEKGRIHTPFVSRERAAPEIFLGGDAAPASALAAKHASCLWRLPATPERLRHDIAPLLRQGTEVGLLVSLVARPTRREALEAAGAHGSGSADALVGSFEEVADALLTYKSVGVSQFLFAGRHDLGEIRFFGEGVLPLVRGKERDACL